MVEHRSLLKIGVTVLAVNVIIQLFAGIMAGFAEDWMRVTLFLFGAVLSVFFATTILLGMGLMDRLTRLEDRFHIDQRTIPVVVRRIGAGVGVLTVASVAICMSLSIIAGFHREWLRLAIYLVVCAITAIICTGISAFLGINMRFSRLERRMADEPANSPQS